ncbi:MAG: ABC transporter permease [Bradymonadaceae bacterium]|nr:ABC transporter permease [Lujinxingiaceae bacterium]
MNRVSALVLRYMYLYRRSLARLGEVFFWPVMELLVWGFLTMYLESEDVGMTVSYLLGAIILWDVLYRAQMAISLSFTEEIWVRNLLNLFVAPLRTFEIPLATASVGVIRALVSLTLLSVLAAVLYAFDITAVGFALVPFVASLLLFGWAVGLVTMALVLRFGQAAEALVWGVPFLIQPFSAVFYPVSILPVWLQPLAWSLPSTYVFEGMRAALASGVLDGSLLAMAFVLNVVYLILGTLFLGLTLKTVREKGYLSRIGME